MAGYIGAKVGTVTANAADIKGDISATDTTPEIVLKNTSEEDIDGGREGTVTFKGERSGGEEVTLAQIEGSHHSTNDDNRGQLIFKTNNNQLGDNVTEAKMTIDSVGDVNVTSGAPSLTITNTTHEDTDGGREGKLKFQGEQSGGELSTLAEIEASHEGTADDEKGELIFRTNDGNDGASPTERMRIDSSGNVGIGTSSPDTLLRLDTVTSGSISSGNNRSGSIIKLHHEAQWESGYGNNALATSNDFLGGIEFSTGDSSTGEGVRAAVRATVDSYYNTNSLVFEVAPDSTASAPVEQMRINPAGIVTMPNQPSFGASVPNNNGTFNAGDIVPFTTQLWDVGNNYDNSSSQCKFTAPVAGKYFYSIMISQYGAENVVTIYKNGSSHITIQMNDEAQSDGWQHESTSGILDLASNDTVQLKFEAVGSVGSGMVDGGSTLYERFCMHLLGQENKMPNITVTLTDTQNKALEYAALSPSDWVTNAATNRARIAKDEIIAKLVAHCNANSVALAVGEDAQVTQAYDLGVVQTAAAIEAQLSSKD